jgi:hypothetical protein
MNPKLSALVDRIKSRYPKLDVRTDQCDVVRMFEKVARVIVTLEEKDGVCTAEFVAMDGENDFEDSVLKTISSENLTRFEAELTKSLDKL